MSEYEGSCCYCNELLSQCTCDTPCMTMEGACYRRGAADMRERAAKVASGHVCGQPIIDGKRDCNCRAHIGSAIRSLPLEADDA